MRFALESYAARTALLFMPLTFVMTWPMTLDIGARYSSRFDYYMGLWNLEWVAQAVVDTRHEVMTTQQLYFPFGTSLEVQPFSLLQTVLATPITLIYEPEVSYNLLVLLSFWASGWLASLWVHAATGDSVAGWVGGVIFAFCPYHYTYLSQLNLVGTAVIPLYFLAVQSPRVEASPSETSAAGSRLGPGWGTGRAVWAGIALAAVALTSWYYGVAVGLAAAALSAARLARPRGALGMDRRWRLEALHWGSFGLILVAIIGTVMAGHSGSGGFVAGPERTGMSFIMSNFKTTGATMTLWSYAGIATLLLAALGCGHGRKCLPYIFMVAVFCLLSFGMSFRIGALEIPLPYAWLQKLPLVDVMRYSDRFFPVAQLGLAALAGFGVQLVRARVRHSGTVLLVAVSLLLVALPLLEFWPGPLQSMEGSAGNGIPVARGGDRGAVLHVPTRFRNLDAEYMLQQLEHGRPIAGGYLTRRNEPIYDRWLADKFMGVFVHDEPRDLPEGLAAGLRRHGFEYVSVYRRSVVEGVPAEPLFIAGPFSLSSTRYMGQRNFPMYRRAAVEPANVRAWIDRLTPILGKPIAETPTMIVFRVPGESG